MEGFFWNVGRGTGLSRLMLIVLYPVAPDTAGKYSQTSVHELNSFLKFVRKPKIFSP
jgi:hypothetical protein